MHRTKHGIAPAFAAMALLLSASSAMAADIPWKMEGYSEPAAASTADSEVRQNFFHSVWSIAESNWIKLKAEFATFLIIR